jgi:hypothetical protein
MRILAVSAAALLVVFVANCDVELRRWTSTGASNVPAAKDVNRVVDAGYGARLDASFQNLYAMINGVNIKTPGGVSVLVHQVPGVAGRIMEEIDAARLRVAAARVETPTGRRLRGVMLRGLLAERLMYRDLLAGLTGDRAARKSFARWVRRYNQLRRWFGMQFQAVVQDAPYEDRAPVVAALNQL